jgi:hypothetical protein
MDEQRTGWRRRASARGRRRQADPSSPFLADADYPHADADRDENNDPDPHGDAHADRHPG